MGELLVREFLLLFALRIAPIRRLPFHDHDVLGGQELADPVPVIVIQGKALEALLQLLPGDRVVLFSCLFQQGRQPLSELRLLLLLFLLFLPLFLLLPLECLIHVPGICSFLLHAVPS